MSLFRKEALEYRADRLHGEVNLALPVSWQLIGYGLLAALAIALLFLAVASYSRVETVPGAVVLDRGVAPIVPTRQGIVAALHVKEGETVEAGASLAQISADENLAAGGTAPERILAAIEEQDTSLARQSQQILTAAEAERSRLAAQIDGLVQEIAHLDRQMGVQRELVASAAREVELIQDVAKRGFISRRDVLQREETLLARQQQLAQYGQQRSAREAALAEARRDIARVEAQARAEAASLSSSRAALAQRRVDAQAARGYVLTAPVEGTVTAITARIGQAVSSEQPLMTLMPKGATPRVELYVPSSAAGFLEAGQNVRLAVDAFPYQRFGTVEAEIVQVSSAAIPRAGAEGTTVPVYLVTAALAHPWVMAFGERQPLLPGMTLTARIVTEEQSLFEWLFEPLLAVKNR
ncbi:HlyD family secretion protein [Sphingosinicella humi]|uniref:HlyD family secretion protein n=1 Tax=Allosphingosinicella humi TaxID=2068657 RepID=UPI001FB066DC|nr:HlyD family efflux transporter periplasmic adaptor subunit [Sphingosinicella humi]